MIPVGDSIPSRGPSVALWLLIAANVFVFMAEASLPPDVRRAFFHVFGLIPAVYGGDLSSTWHHRPWPFFTNMFLHAGWAHIFANMWTLWIFGDNVEDKMGPIRFAVFYVLCGVAASVAHAAANPSSTVPAVGASGAVAGVMGAYLLLFPSSRIILLVPVLFLPLFVQVPAVFYIALWSMSQVFSGILTLGAPAEAGGVAWWAHVGGFAAGLALFRFFLLPKKSRRDLMDDELDIGCALCGAGKPRRGKQ